MLNFPEPANGTAKAYVFRAKVHRASDGREGGSEEHPFESRAQSGVWYVVFYDVCQPDVGVYGDRERQDQVACPIWPEYCRWKRHGIQHRRVVCRSFPCCRWEESFCLLCLVVLLELLLAGKHYLLFFYCFFLIIPGFIASLGGILFRAREKSVFKGSFKWLKRERSYCCCCERCARNHFCCLLFYFQILKNQFSSFQGNYVIFSNYSVFDWKKKKF